MDKQNKPKELSKNEKDKLKEIREKKLNKIVKK